jgi:hypothetical protein
MHFTSFFLKFKSYLLVKRFFFLLSSAFAMAILDLISQVHPASSVVTAIFCDLQAQIYFFVRNMVGVFVSSLQKGLEFHDAFQDSNLLNRI